MLPQRVKFRGSIYLAEAIPDVVKKLHQRLNSIGIICTPQFDGDSWVLNCPDAGTTFSYVPDKPWQVKKHSLSRDPLFMSNSEALEFADGLKR